MAPTDDSLFTRKNLKRSAMSRSNGSSAFSGIVVQRLSAHLISSLSHPPASTPFIVLEPNPKKPRLSNARFDRMVETMTVVHPHSTVGGHTSPPGKKTQSKRKGSRHQMDKYSPPVSSDLGHELSFIKMAPKHLPNALESSSSPSTMSKAESSTSKPRSTCNPLPSWLTNTFMSLSKKHPLRLLLPSNLTRPDTPRKTFKETLVWLSPEKRSIESGRVDDETFAFATPDAGNVENPYGTVLNPHEESPSLDVAYNPLSPSDTQSHLFHTRASSSHVYTPTIFEPPMPARHTPSLPVFPASLLPDSTASSSSKHPPDYYSADVEIYPSPTLYYTGFPDDIVCDNGLKPFSTPGPASTIGSSTVGNTLDASGAYLDMQDALEYVDSLDKANNDIQSNAELDKCCETDSREIIHQSFSEVLEDPLLARLYSTPGPRYCAPSAVHFDSPTEDPLGSDPAFSGDEINHAELDFRWTPFDRKGLTVSGASVRPFFAPETPQKIDSPHTPLNYAQRLQNIMSPDSPAITSQLRPVSTGSSSSLAPVSPSPFRFAPPSQSISLSQGHASQKSKVSFDHDMSIEPCRIVTTAPKRPFAVPGVYISPLVSSRSQTPAPFDFEDDLQSGRVALKTITDGTNLQRHQESESKNTDSFNEIQDGPVATNSNAEDKTYPQSQRTSASDDSIESWSAH